MRVASHKDRHDFAAQAENEIEIVKDVPAFICDTRSEVEYMMEFSREIYAIMKDFFTGRLLAASKATGGGRDRIQAPAGGHDGVRRSCCGSNGTFIKHFNLHNFSFAIHGQSELLAFIFK